MNILTDEEIHSVRWSVPVTRMSTDDDYVSLSKSQMAGFARAIEAAIMSKLAEQAGEPVACAAFAENGNIRIWSSVSEPVRKLAEAEGMNLVRLYTEASLIAAQQRTAEACIKAVSAEYLTDPHDATDGAYNLALDHAIGGMKRWREYL